MTGDRPGRLEPVGRRAGQPLAIWTLLGTAIVVAAVAGRTSSEVPPSPAAPSVASGTADPQLQGEVVAPMPGAFVGSDGIIEVLARTGDRDVRLAVVHVTQTGTVVGRARMAVRGGVLHGWVRVEPSELPRPAEVTLRPITGAFAGPIIASQSIVLDAAKPLRITRPWRPRLVVDGRVLEVEGRATPSIKEVALRLERPSGVVLARGRAPVTSDAAGRVPGSFRIALTLRDSPPEGPLWLFATGRDSASGQMASDSLALFGP